MRPHITADTRDARRHDYRRMLGTNGNGVMLTVYTVNSLYTGHQLKVIYNRGKSSDTIHITEGCPFNNWTSRVAHASYVRLAVSRLIKILNSHKEKGVSLMKSESTQEDAASRDKDQREKQVQP